MSKPSFSPHPSSLDAASQPAAPDAAFRRGLEQLAAYVDAGAPRPAEDAQPADAPAPGVPPLASLRAAVVVRTLQRTLTLEECAHVHQQLIAYLAARRAPPEEPGPVQTSLPFMGEE